LALGAKTTTDTKLRGRFCSFFFIGGQNRNFGKVRGLKLLLSLKKKWLAIQQAKYVDMKHRGFHYNMFFSNYILLSFYSKLLTVSLILIEMERKLRKKLENERKFMLNILTEFVRMN